MKADFHKSEAKKDFKPLVAKRNQERDSKSLGANKPRNGSCLKLKVRVIESYEDLGEYDPNNDSSESHSSFCSEEVEAAKKGM